MKLATLEKLRKYVGTKIVVIYRAVTNTYKYEGIMQQFDQGRLVIRQHEPIREGCFWDSGKRSFAPNHIVKVTTEDGKEWY